jgi:metal-dependent amidase/aminoacylase/carboxypeptidase family protein
MVRTSLVVSFALLIGLSGLLTNTSADAHCQVPCGIYDDDARISAMRENATSIRKAMTEISSTMGAGTVVAFNQATRWVIEKDRSATAIQEIAADYFLTQRVKAVEAGSETYGPYIEQLQGFHAVMVAAMKCKQQADTKTADALDAAINTVAKWYQ